LVAARLMEEFYRPVIVVAQGKDWSKASARSIEGFNIVEAIRQSADIIGSHGGHARAAGFSVETKYLSLLQERLVVLAEKQLNKEKLSPTLKIDTEVALEELGLRVYEQIDRLSPFGMNNPQPVFVARNVSVVDAKTVGNRGKHLKLKISNLKFQISLDAIGFGLGQWLPKLAPEKPIDIAFNLTIDEWNGHKKLQLRLRDIKLRGQ